MIGAVVLSVLVVLGWWLFSDSGSDNGKKGNVENVKTNASSSSTASHTAVPKPVSTVKVPVTTRQAIGLEIREKPGKGKTIAEVSEGTDLTATCTADGPNVYGWRGGKSNQWVLVTTAKGVGYAPEAWLETTASAKELLPAC
ncbi:hypothetical protein [Embleya sp. NBC_00896]|uniref:hypothetical protein n=1 Tax=Embleya sp. NBC_00896 TaxID=2975961 RepID=UPI003866B185|nr:hypothetical protein OG928_03045 [Embleya sp. NBC_00896]